MGYNNAAQAGESQIREFTIYSNRNEPVDVSGGFIDLYIHESCLDYSVRSSFTLADTGHRRGKQGSGILESGDLNLTAGEKIFITVDDGYNNRISFKNDYHLRVQRIRDVKEHTGKNVVSVDCYSKECIDNQLVDTRVTDRYDGRISDSVRSILTKTLKTPKNLFIDPSINNFNFLGNTQKPFYMLAWLAPRSVPNIPSANGKYAGYFFYETTDNQKGTGGYHFRALDNFFQQPVKKKLIYTNTPFLPAGYNGKIIEYSINSTVNLDSILNAGALSKTVLKSINPSTHEYKQENTFSDVSRMGNEVMGGIQLPPVATDLDLWNKSARIITKWKPVGFLPTGTDLNSQLNNIEKEDWDIEAIVRQSVARYNNLFNTRINITIPGDFSIHAGDIIFCDFPEISSRATKVVSNKKSGRYLVIDVGHRITKLNCFTTLNIVRESIYRS